MNCLGRDGTAAVLVFPQISARRGWLQTWCDLSIRIRRTDASAAQSLTFSIILPAETSTSSVTALSCFVISSGVACSSGWVWP